MTELIYLSSFKWPKKCRECGLQIETNAEGYWDKERKLYYHKGCKPNADPIMAGASGRPRAGKPSEVVLTSSEANVSARLRKAHEMVDSEFPEAKEYTSYYDLVAEVMHQLISETWLKKEM